MIYGILYILEGFKYVEINASSSQEAAHQEVANDSNARSAVIEEQSSPSINVPGSDVKLQLEGGDDDAEA